MKHLVSRIRILALRSARTEVFWVVAIIAIGLFFPTYSAHASIFSSFTDALVGAFTSWLLAIPTFILVLIQSILGLFVVLAGAIMDQILRLALEIRYIPGETGDAVTVGWTIMRDLANMALILVLAALGIGAILGKNVEQLGSRIATFIGVALLINFTPVITGVIIDFSNILTQLFFDPIAGAWRFFLKDIGDGFGSLGAFLTLNASASINAMVSAIVGIIFNIATIGAFALVSILLIARIVALWLLVILSPIVFVAYILPQTKRWFTSWWKNFWQWSIIGIPLGFFLFLSMTILETGKNSCGSGFNASITTQIDAVGGSVGSVVVGSGFLSDMCGSIMHIVALGTLFVGFFITFQLSAAGSNMIMKQAKSAGQWGRKQLTSPKNLGRAARAGMRTNVAATKAVTKFAERRLPAGARRRVRAERRKAQIRGRAAIGAVEKVAGKVLTPEQQRAVFESTREKMGLTTRKGIADSYGSLEKGKWTKEELLRFIKNPTTSPDKRRAAQMLLAKKHPEEFDKYKDENKGATKGIYGDAKRAGKLDDIISENPQLTKDPDFVKEVGKSTADIIRKLTRAQIDKLSKAALSDGDVVYNLLKHESFSAGKKGGTGYVQNLIDRGEFEKVMALGKGLASAIEGNNAEERFDSLDKMADSPDISKNAKKNMLKTVEALRNAKTTPALQGMDFFKSGPGTSPGGRTPTSGAGPRSPGSRGAGLRPEVYIEEAPENESAEDKATREAYEKLAEEKNRASRPKVYIEEVPKNESPANKAERTAYEKLARGVGQQNRARKAPRGPTGQFRKAETVASRAGNIEVLDKFHHNERNVAAVRMPDGKKRLFYQSSRGTGGKEAGRWYPIDGWQKEAGGGHPAGWFIKDKYYKDSEGKDIPPQDEMYGYGSDEDLRAIGDTLKEHYKGYSSQEGASSEQIFQDVVGNYEDANKRFEDLE